MLTAKLWIYLVLVTCAAFAAYVFNKDPHAYWIIWSALSLAILPRSLSLKKQIWIILLVGLGLAGAVAINGLVNYSFILLCTYLFILLIATTYSSLIYDQCDLALFVITLFALIASFLLDGWSASLNSALYILAGMLIALIAKIVYLPYAKRDEKRFLLNESIQYLVQLNTDIFACLLEPEYADYKYLYERRLHIKRDQCLTLLTQLNALIEQNEMPDSSPFVQLANKLSLFYEMMLDYSQLRFRVTDLATLSLCQPELQGIKEEINNALNAVYTLLTRKQPKIYASNLSEKLTFLERNFEQVVKVAAPDPLVFLLFIATIKSFYEEWEHLSETVLKAELILR